MTPPRILIIEDEAALAGALAEVCRRLGAQASLCASGSRGLNELAKGKFALVILDIGLPDTSGWAVLESINRSAARPPVLIITAHGTLDNAVAARQLAAAEYLVKPLDLRELERTIGHLLNERDASASRAAPGAEAGALLGGASPEMQRVFIAIAQAATTDAPALITGPTGTGKTLAARVIHANSRRRTGPFITLLCGALPEHLLESELFGHEKNAFTGAGSMRPGHLERAAGGTLLLDEIGDIPLSVQAKLLRFVDEKTFARVGGREDLRVDLRLLAATNRSLREEVRSGRFREDLYYRLHVLEIEMPPLARRREDIPALAAFFLSQIAGGRELGLGAEASRLIVNYNWPGNVRELRNVLERAAAACSGKIILPRHLPAEISHPMEPAADADLNAVLERWVAAKVTEGVSYKKLCAGVESTLLRHLMRHFAEKPTVLARVLKMNRATLLKKRRTLGLE
ncbi:MAG TPA: sigma-54 dependent transcriptional regulator [Verrucomicrobiae bacterium]|jgi:DNA-binding NtrC family response regulator